MRHASPMDPVEPPARLDPPPPGLGRLGAALSWLAAAQGGWPPHSPQHRRDIELGDGGLVAGRAAADSLADAGADLLVLEGPPATAAALVVLCALLDVEPVLAVGTAAGPGWAELVVAVRDGLPAARALVGDPEQLVADPVVGHAAGLLAQSAVRRTPVVLGPSPTLAAAALAAERLAPGASRWWLAACKPSSTAVTLAYAELVLDPLLDLGLRVPGGAALAVNLLTSAVGLIGE
jgi:nicotinate-nucleotide--dimethylbenzimidazole phosphoribosyltransferase